MDFKAKNQEKLLVKELGVCDRFLSANRKQSESQSDSPGPITRSWIRVFSVGHI